MNKIGIACAVLMFQTNVYASDIKTTAGIKTLCDESAEAFGKGNIEETFKILKPHFGLPEQEFKDLIYNTSSAIEKYKDRQGDFIGSEFVSAKKLGNSYTGYNYLIKLEKTPLRYRCFAYKAENKWSIHTVLWDSSPFLYFK